MKKRNKDKKRIPISKDNELLNIDSFSTISSDVIDLVYEEAQNGVKSLATNIDLMQDRMMILLGWFAAAEISLIGVLVGIVASDCPKPISLILNIYGVVALAVILVYLVSKGLYGTEVLEVGDTPSHYLDSSILDKLKAVDNVDDQKKQVKIMQLNTLQKAVMENMRTNNRLVDVYRRVMLFVLIAAGIGAILLLVLSLVL